MRLQKPVHPGQRATNRLVVRISNLSLVIDESASASKSRIALLIMVNLNLRLMENWRSVQNELWGKTLDYESTMILLAVVAIRTEQLAKPEWEPKLESLAAPAPHDRLKLCNLSSVATTTGLNRETVRRRVLRLSASGLLKYHTDGGIGMGDSIMQSEQVRVAVQEQNRALHRASNAMIAAGIFHA